jgi:hypothetical protein
MTIPVAIVATVGNKLGPAPAGARQAAAFDVITTHVVASAAALSIAAYDRRRSSNELAEQSTPTRPWHLRLWKNAFKSMSIFLDSIATRFGIGCHVRCPRPARLMAIAIAIIGLHAGIPAAATRQPVDVDASTITVRVYKAGLFRAFGDNHEIQAPIKDGFIDDAESPWVQIVIEARRLRVLDPSLSPHNREEVQTRMLGPDVLDANQFPEIRFQSTAVGQVPSGGWMVREQLTLHGHTEPVTVRLLREHSHYTGSASLKQTAFGITPIAIAGGTKVKTN